MDWKLERAIQAKVRDFQNKTKRHDCWSAPMEEHSTLVYKWQLLPDFRSTMSFIPKRHQLLPCAGFCPVNGSICSQSHYLQGSLPSVCTAMTVHLQSYLLCLVSLSLFVIYNSCSHTNYIHTLILSHIHTHQIHNINSYMVASVTQSHV